MLCNSEHSAGHGCTESGCLRVKSEEPKEAMAEKIITTIKKVSRREIKGNVQLHSDVDANQKREEHLFCTDAAFGFFLVFSGRNYLLSQHCVCL